MTLGSLVPSLIKGEAENRAQTNWLAGNSSKPTTQPQLRIEGHNCGRYKEDREKEAARAEQDLKLYMHYHSKWQGLIESLKLVAKPEEVVQDKIAKLEESKSHVKDNSWLSIGLQHLFRARRALLFLYPSKYFMFRNVLFKDDITLTESDIGRNLFENQQRQLEVKIECLCKAIEIPFEFKVDNSRVAQFSSIANNLCKRTRKQTHPPHLPCGTIHLTG
ncbi:hypothetical protein L7F22_042722 [Adiantum nelumboides]|nr:hypothetical protein [Adiantum nelumboides]